MASPYRERAPRPPKREWQPDRVVTFSKYGPLWFVFISVIAIGLIVAGLSLASWTSIVCRRATDGSPACELVIKRLIHVEREAIGAVDVQEALIGDEGSKPCLRVDLARGGTQWFQLGSRNEPVASAVRAYRQSSTPTLDQPVQSNAWIFAMLPLTGLLLFVLVLAAEKRTRIEIELESGKLRAVTRSLFASNESIRELDMIESFDCGSVGEDSNFSRIYSRRGHKKKALGEAGDLRASQVVRELDAILAERRKLLERQKRET